MKSQPRKLATLAILLVLIAVGCGPDEEQLPPSAPTNFPIGKFRTIDNQWGGEFVLETKSNGNYTITVNEYYVLPGSYSLTKNQIVLMGFMCEGEGKGFGSYTWKFDGKTLTFYAVEDKCYERWRVFNYAWTKIK